MPASNPRKPTPPRASKKRSKSGRARPRRDLPVPRVQEEVPAWLPGFMRDAWNDVSERIPRLATRTNEYGFDPFGYDPSQAQPLMAPVVWLYRNYFRAQATGVENVPDGRVLLIANHAGNTFAWDAAMLSTALFLECEPPRIARGMGEYFLPTIPFFNIAMGRAGSVVGTPENCRALLEHEEAVMVFPEGERGFIKPYSEAYELQPFGQGFLRLALETKTPIVPVGIVGGEEHSPGLLRSERLGSLIGAPALPITAGFPFLGPLGMLPLPVKFQLSFGEALEFDGDPNDDDAAIGELIEVVRDEIRKLIRKGLARRDGWFA